MFPTAKEPSCPPPRDDRTTLPGRPGRPRLRVLRSGVGQGSHAGATYPEAQRARRVEAHTPRGDTSVSSTTDVALSVLPRQIYVGWDAWGRPATAHEIAALIEDRIC